LNSLLYVSSAIYQLLTLLCVFSVGETCWWQQTAQCWTSWDQLQGNMGKCVLSQFWQDWRTSGLLYAWIWV